jgi:hypothetical protein
LKEFKISLEAWQENLTGNTVTETNNRQQAGTEAQK